MDKDSGFRITTNYKNSDNRNVLNTKEIPEYLKLNTHFREERGDLKAYQNYDSIEFSDNSFNFMAAEEDENILSGKVKPVSKRGNTSVEPAVQNKEILAEENSSIPRDEFDILGGDTIVVNKPSSSSLPDFLYSPVVLTVLLLVFILLIVLEIMGMFFLLR
ncbi:MAG: hypothetical protein MJ172_02560 [Clostridia bacterium]|nr:hypothetical protein [Clostridia bacterium]